MHYHALQVLIIFASGATLFVSSSSLEEDEKPDADLDIDELIEKYGYPLEIHSNIRTSDGYLLDLHRIPYGKRNADKKRRRIALLMHGLLCSSMDWVVLGPEKSLVYNLAEAGYDVWMGNARGNTYSRKHVTLNPDKDAKFWDFSWHEIGTRDLPAIIDYILEVTEQKALFYIGHSQGTSAFFVLASEKPEYNEKIRLMTALSPIAFLSHMASPVFNLMVKFLTTTKWLVKFFGINEILPNNGPFASAVAQTCQNESPNQGVCKSFLFMLCGWDSAQTNMTIIPVILANTPAGSSIKQILHYGQLAKSGRFQKYDYGPLNSVKYKKKSPPDYKLENITAPIALFYSKNDWLNSITDVKKLQDELPNVVLDYLIPYPSFNHLDFIYATNARVMVYSPAMLFMRYY